MSSAAPSPVRRRLIDLAGAVAAAIISVAVAVVAFRISPADLSQRWQAGGDDAILHYTLFTSATQSFSFADNPALGFPDGLNVFFSSQVDVASALVMAAMATVLDGGLLMLNLYYLLTFAATAVTGYAFLRAVRVRPAVGVLFAVLFSVAPYHFFRVAAGHAFLAAYWAIPLAGILVLVAAGPSTDPFRRWGARYASPLARRLAHGAPVVMLSLLIATTGAYYFVFAAIVVAGTWAARVVAVLVRREGVRQLAWPTLAFGSLAASVGTALVVLGLGFGERYAPYVNDRLVGESEYYAGKLVTLLTPWAGSDLTFFDEFAAEYAKGNAISTTEPPGAPLLASIGIVLLFAVVFVTTATSGRGLQATAVGRFVTRPQIRVLAFATAWTFAFYIVSGLGVFVALVIGPQIRAWSRLSIFLILFGLAAVALLVDAVPRKAGLKLAAVLAVVAVAVPDQVTGVDHAYPIRPTDGTQTSVFVEAAEEALPDGCGVVQLPLKSFPDSGKIGQLNDYDEALPYLYSTPGQLEWSYGSVRGTTGWDVWADVRTARSFAETVEETSACAVLVDTAGYSDAPQGWRPFVEAAAGDVDPEVASADGRYLLFEVSDPKAG
ncbi:hypothetical protein ES689_02130 [Frigoribacterium sp. ACAM 257]|uniref:hypothetical protein n=1 Tax=Frigoribacterium sp. ACAM 257 TaxID=2508998 RepID=UPI0011B9AC33|nr:hypothetical protein [Frigoribacterium sp. ACAM 257]TWX40286.1 hypothetical protein ES689_02130 [Frigoribacterium sp. ACAM 257]